MVVRRRFPGVVLPALQVERRERLFGLPFAAASETSVDPTFCSLKRRTHPAGSTERRGTETRERSPVGRVIPRVATPHAYFLAVAIVVVIRLLTVDMCLPSPSPGRLAVLVYIRGDRKKGRNGTRPS